MTTTTELSDEDLMAICDEAFSVNHQRYAENRELYNAGRASRDAEVEALEAERDKLHAALAWREKHPRSITMFGAPEYYWTRWFDGSSLREHFDGTPAGQAAALVRLWEKVTGGFGTKP